MTGRPMLLASAVMAASGLWSSSAGAAPIRADMSLQSGAVFEQVQMKGRSGGAGFSQGAVGGSAAMSRGAAPGFSSSAAINNRGGVSNFSGDRVIRSGNWDGRRFSDGRFRRGFRGPGFAFGIGPSYYDYGYYG